VVKVSTNPANFSYCDSRARGVVGYRLRRRAADAVPPAGGRFDVLLIDAFSSDSVPAHLLTVEAMRMYLAKIKSDGVIILHLSNRNLELDGPAQAVALAAGGHALPPGPQRRPALAADVGILEDAVIVAKTPAGLVASPPTAAGALPTPAASAPGPTYYTNLFGALSCDALQGRWRNRPVRS